MDVTGKWQAENKDDLITAMKTIGVPDVFITCSPDMKLQLEIESVGDDTYRFKEKIILPLNEHTVKIGKGFETVNWLGKSIKGVVEKEGNKIVEKSKEGDVPYAITFETKEGKLIRTRKYATSKCSLTYTKL